MECTRVHKNTKWVVREFVTYADPGRLQPLEVGIGLGNLCKRRVEDGVATLPRHVGQACACTHHRVNPTAHRCDKVRSTRSLLGKVYDVITTSGSEHLRGSRRPHGPSLEGRMMLPRYPRGGAEHTGWQAYLVILLLLLQDVRDRHRVCAIQPCRARIGARYCNLPVPREFQSRRARYHCSDCDPHHVCKYLYNQVCCWKCFLQRHRVTLASNFSA